MSTRTRTRAVEEQLSYLADERASTDLEAIGDDELEAMFFDENEERPKGFWNLPTVAGLSLIVVGVAYIFQELGIWRGFDLSVLVGMLPWLAGILIILLGFGVLSWRPRKKKKQVRVARTVHPEQKIVLEAKPATTTREKKRLVKTRDKKLAGVCGGIAEYFSIDPTLVRIAFVIGTIATQGSFLIAYLILAFVMPKPESVTDENEKRVTIVRY